MSYNKIIYFYLNLKEKDEHALYFNEDDIQKKLAKIKLRVDKVTRKPRYIKELNELGKRKPKVEECKDDDKSPQSKINIKNI